LRTGIRSRFLLRYCNFKSSKPDILLDNLRYDTGADGTAAFADCEAQTFFHSDRGDASP
jgi:hypothetical protein